jgi:HEAT repeat protein
VRSLTARTLPWVLLTVVAAAPLTARAEGGDAPGARVQALYAKYEKLTPYTDFASFSDRMATVRALGHVDDPQARKLLLGIVRRAKAVDDRIVAVETLGHGLDVSTAKELSGIVARKNDPLMVQALSDAFTAAHREDVLTWLAGDALHAKDPGVLLAAVDAQYLHADPRARDRLHEIFDENRDHKTGILLASAALRAIGSIALRKDRIFMMRGPSYADWRLRLAVADTIALQKPVDVNIRGVLRRLLHDDSAVVREAAATAIGNARVVELTDDVADLLNDVHLKTRAVAKSALERMHDKDLGWDADDWKRWWKTLSVDPKRIQRAPSSSVATYYGVQIHSDRLLFIVDLSGSMAFPWGREASKTRIGVARQQLHKVLAGLDRGTLFNVIVFSDRVKAWRKGETLATKEAVAQALAWIDERFRKPKGGTFMHAALETAFEQNPQVDTIYLLTDGLATDGEPIVPEAILASVNRWNRFRRVVIDTFALTLEDLDPQGLNKANLVEIKRFMRRLATLTGGTCTVITHPPK